MTEAEQREYDSYIENRFEGAEELTEQNTDFLAPWEEIASYAEENGAAAAINELVCPKRPTDFRSPGTLSLKIEDSFAGRIPVIRVRDTADFEDLVTNVAYKGIRSSTISQTGASFVFGKTTRFFILSSKPYSNIPAEDLGLSEEDWAASSMELRFGHESTHYFTKQTFGITNNILHDEIMADFTGLYMAFGCYRAEWFLRFMGLLGEREGRLLHYTKELTEPVRDAVGKLLSEAAQGLEKWSWTDAFLAMSAGDRIKYLCRLGLPGMTGLS